MIPERRRPKANNDAVETALKADAFEAAQKEIGEIVAGRKDKETLEDFIDRVRSEGPIKNIEAAREQLMMPDSQLGSETNSTDDVRVIGQEVMRRAEAKKQGRVLDTRSTQTRGNIDNSSMSPNKSASLNSAGIRQEAASKKKDLASEQQDDANNDRSDSPARSGNLMQRLRDARARRKAAEADSMKKNKGSMDAFSFVLFFMIFVVSVLVDTYDLVVALTGVGAFLSPIKSLIVLAILGPLRVVAGGEFKPGGLKKLFGTSLLEAIPLLCLAPIYTISCLLDFFSKTGLVNSKRLGSALDTGLGNKISDGIRKAIS